MLNNEAGTERQRAYYHIYYFIMCAFTLLTGKPHSYLGRLVGSLCSACAGPLKCLTLLKSEPREGKLIKLGSGFLNSTSKWCESLLDPMSSLSDWGLQFSGTEAL